MMYRYLVALLILCFGLTLAALPATEECDALYFQAMKVVESDQANAYKLFTDALNKSNKAWPRRAECLYQRGMLQLGPNPDAAMFDFTMAIQADPKHILAHKYAGIALFSLNNMTLSLQELDFAEQLGKEDPEIKLYRGLIYLRLHQEGGQLLQSNMVNAAIKEFDAALKIKKKYPEVYYYKGFANKIVGDLKEAAKQFGLAVKYKSDYIPAYKELATIYADLNELENAMETYIKIIEIDPKIYPPYEKVINYGEVLKNPEQVKSVLKTAVQHFSNHPFIMQKAREYSVPLDMPLNAETKKDQSPNTQNTKMVTPKDSETGVELETSESPVKKINKISKSDNKKNTVPNTDQNKTTTWAGGNKQNTSSVNRPSQPVNSDKKNEHLDVFPSSNWY